MLPYEVEHSICLNSSTSTVNSGLQLLFMHTMHYSLSIHGPGSA
jgi:hypothetical protein